MSDTKTGGNRWVPDIRPENMDTYTETYTSEGGTEQSEEYRITDADPIIGGMLDRLAFFRTHASAVWYNRLAGVTVRQKIDEMEDIIGETGRNLENFLSASCACIPVLFPESPVNVVVESRDGNTLQRMSFLLVGSISGGRVFAMYGGADLSSELTVLQSSDIVRQNGSFKETVQANLHTGDVKKLRIRFIPAEGVGNAVHIIIPANVKVTNRWDG